MKKAMLFFFLLEETCDESELFRCFGVQDAHVFPYTLDTLNFKCALHFISPHKFPLRRSILYKALMRANCFVALHFISRDCKFLFSKWFLAKSQKTLHI